MKLPWIAPFGVLVAAACASADSSPEAGPSPSPTPDATASEDGGVENDGGTDAEGGAVHIRPSCTADQHWCFGDIVDLGTVGVSRANLEFTSIVVDPIAGAWATSSSAVNGGNPGYGGPNMGHLFQLQGNVWTPRAGLRPGHPDALPYLLRSVASDGRGTVVAVGIEPQKITPEPRYPVVFLVRPGGSEIEEDRPTGFAGFTGVLVASATEAWARDLQGALYRGVIGGAGPIVWALELTPHYSLQPGSLPACTAFWFTKAGDLVCASSEPNSVPLGPPLAVFDIRHVSAAGEVTWTTKKFERFEVWAGSFTSAFEFAPGKTWLSGTNLIGIPGSLEYYPDPALFVVDETSADADAGVDGISLSETKPRTTFAMWGRAEDDIWAVGRVGRVFHHDGATWSDSALEIEGTPMTTRDLSAVSGLPSGELWVAGKGVLIHRKP